MEAFKLKSLSKFMSLVLRHQPEMIGLKLDEQGWAFVEELLAKMQQAGKHITAEILAEVVETNDKKRFAFNEDGTKIRASQGHSIAVELAYSPMDPPEFLYHGTGVQNKESIIREGIRKGKRHHVHLSAQKDTAVQVGSRHGKPFVFVVQAGKMARAGNTFFQSENGVWLTDFVAPEFLG